MKFEIKQRIEQINNGQVPDGYKKTEFGVFPCDWATDKTFGDLFSFNGGLGKSREELSENGIEYLHYGDMHRADFNLVSLEQYSKLPKYDTQVNGDESYLMQDGDVAFLDASEDLDGTSRAVLIDNPENKPFIAGLHIIYGKSKTNELSKYYKQYITRPEQVKKQFQKLASGFKVYGLNRNTISKIKYAYPADTKEQEKIAEILMKWDEAIQLQEKYVEKLIIKKDKIIHELLKAQEGWIKTTLSKVLIEKSERTKINNQHQVLSSTRLGLVAQSDYFDKQVASEDNTGYKIIRKGEIVLSPQNLWLGNINYNDSFDIGIVSPSYKIFGVKNNFDKLFVSTLMKSSKMLHQYILSSEQGASVVRRNLNMDLFYDIQICVPTFEKQRRISTIISVSQKLIEFEKKKLDKMKHQRQTLQQYLLNGIVRVNDER